MASVRLHLANIPSPNTDTQFLTESSSAVATLLTVGVHSATEAWTLAEYVDLVDAGLCPKNIQYRQAKQALGYFVRKNWETPACRGMCGRSAYMAEVLSEILEQHAQEIALTGSSLIAA